MSSDYDKEILSMISPEITELMEREKADRQASGRFEFNEVVEMLATEAGETRTFIYSELSLAFANREIQFWRVGGSPAIPVDDSWMASGYLIEGEFTTPEEINRWLSSWGAKYRFPEKFRIEPKEHIPKGKLQESAILEWLTLNKYDPLALPPHEGLSKANPGVKAEAKKELTESCKRLLTTSTFDAAWKRLRKQGLLKEQL